MIKDDSKYFYIVTKNISNKCCSSELSTHENSLEKISVSTKIIKLKLENQLHIRIISEGSCDTEDWRNDAENTAAHHRNKLQFNIYYNRKQLL